MRFAFKPLLKALTVAAVGAFAVGGLAQSARANGFIALEGSDATALHQDPTYTPQMFHYLSGGSSAPVLIYNPAGTRTITYTGPVSVVYSSSLAGLSLTTATYSAIYIESPYGCCNADNTALNGFGAAINAFIAAGGNLSIENYKGGTYDGVVPGGNAPSGAIAGVGTPFSPLCTDGERVNANGIAKGFGQPRVDGCWSHQGYENSYWLPLGYVSLFDSATNATDAASGGYGPGGFTFADGTQIGSSLLAFGGTLGTVPEPATFGLFGAGVIGLALVRRRKAA